MDANPEGCCGGHGEYQRQGQEALEMVLAATDLEILDRGIELTFQTELRCEVLDLTLCSKNLIDETSAGCRDFPKRHGSSDSTLPYAFLVGDMASGEWCPVHLLKINFSGFKGEYDIESDIWVSEPRVFSRGHEKGQIIGPLTRTLRACLALGYTPKAWRLARVVFIPKIGRTCFTSAKDYKPINLTSFFLKTLEKLVDVYLKEHPENILRKNLSDKGIYAQGYADDLAILVRRPFLDTLMELTQSALETMKEWCDNTDLLKGLWHDLGHWAKDGPLDLLCYYSPSAAICCSGMIAQGLDGDG
ncbi:unnamed protein product [Lasius platythorax]|uniref:Reverse transcriptase n=1 Tax=Lasius platythorax TaxID=488582 RepID=A0AAV2MWX2_9HYME